MRTTGRGRSRLGPPGRSSHPWSGTDRYRHESHGVVPRGCLVRRDRRRRPPEPLPGSGDCDEAGSRSRRNDLPRPGHRPAALRCRSHPRSAGSAMTMSGRSIRGLVLMTALLSLCGLSPAAAQTSTSFKLQESSLNNGGDPRAGAALVSAHFHLSLDAIGDGVVRAGLSSGSFHVDGGFVGRYRPAGEVKGLLFSNAATLQWNPDPSADRYEIYRGATSTLPGTFGTCFASDLTIVTANDASIPSKGAGYFYLVTARNRLGEE